MKNVGLVLFVYLGMGLSILIGQSVRSMEKGELLLSVGVNTINSQGTKNPVGNISDWAFKQPFSAGIESYWSRLFSIEVQVTLNGYNAGDAIDAAGPSDIDLTHIALDTHLKYYFGEFIFPKSERIDFYGLAGLGYFDVDIGNISANFGGGAVYWFNKRTKAVGLKVQGVAKFALNHDNTGSTYTNNHFQYNMMLVFRLYE
jgi:hypothetical protein